MAEAVLTVTLCIVLGSPGAFAGEPCENEVVFQGYEHVAIDDGCLEIDAITRRLKISNLGSAGCDGFRISLGDLTGPEVFVVITACLIAVFCT